MENRLIPPPELSPPSIKHLSVGERILLWAKAVDDEDARMRELLRAQIGPEGDLEAAFREWLEKEYAELDRAKIEMLREMTRRERFYPALARLKSTRSLNGPDSAASS